MRSHLSRLLTGVVLSAITLANGADKVMTLRVPDGGFQPQIATDAHNVIHMLYFKGDAAAGNLFYVKSTDGVTFTPPISVNSQPDSAIAVGSIRGARLAVGVNGWVHVAWMGSKNALKAPGDSTPMLYSRLREGGAFEPQRNVLQFATGLDGGGTVAADTHGNVFVVWHSNAGKEGESNRRVWIARSKDNGATFSREEPVQTAPFGACGCCGMSALADSNNGVYILYRIAGGGKIPDVRDMFLLSSKDNGATFQARDLHPWKLPTCAMSTSSLYESGAGVLAAWETKGHIYFCKLDKEGQPVKVISAPGAASGRKHPALAANAAGDVLLAWTAGMGWQKGGSFEWQVYDGNGEPVGQMGRAEGVPANGLVAAFARPDGGFTVVY